MVVCTYNAVTIVVLCRDGASTLNKDNPLYESQEIRMEMFADIQSDDDDGKQVYAIIVVEYVSPSDSLDHPTV